MAPGARNSKVEGLDNENGNLAEGAIATYRLQFSVLTLLTAVALVGVVTSRIVNLSNGIDRQLIKSWRFEHHDPLLIGAPEEWLCFEADGVFIRIIGRGPRFIGEYRIVGSNTVRIHLREIARFGEPPDLITQNDVQDRSIIVACAVDETAYS